MRTMGRRMQGKVRPEFHVSSRPTLQLESMNLGCPMPLTDLEERFFSCRDACGRVVDGLYAAPVTLAGHADAAGCRRMLCRDVLSLSQSVSLGIDTEVVAGVRSVRMAALGEQSCSTRKVRTRPAGVGAQRALHRALVEKQVLDSNRARVLAARAAFEEADRLKRSGRNPGERSCVEVSAGGDEQCFAPAIGRRGKESYSRSTCGGTWEWRVELAKRRILRSRQQEADTALAPTFRQGVMRRVGQQALAPEKLSCGSKLSARHQWWAACKDYECAVLRCVTMQDVLEVRYQADARVVSWHALGCSGLRARRAGVARVVIARRSPGSGVSRRQRGRSISRGQTLDRELCTDVAGQQSAAAIKSSLAGRLRVEDRGSRWHGMRAKCLQAAVVDLLRGEQRNRVERRLKRQCCNALGAGYAGGVREAKNLESVRRCLLSENLYVRVCESSCQNALESADVQGVWHFGAPDGVLLGTLVWLSVDQHVVRVEGNDVTWMPRPSEQVPPWHRYVVGAPKEE